MFLITKNIQNMFKRDYLENRFKVFLTAGRLFATMIVLLLYNSRVCQILRVRCHLACREPNANGHRDFLGILWVLIFFPWLFHGYDFFCLAYSVDLKVFFMSSLWALNFFFAGSKFPLMGNFCPDENKSHRSISETAYSIPNRFQQW